MRTPFNAMTGLISLRDRFVMGIIDSSVKQKPQLCTGLTDDADIRRQCKGNVLLRKFNIICSMYVKLALFRCYCLTMYLHSSTMVEPYKIHDKQTANYLS